MSMNLHDSIISRRPRTTATSSMQILLARHKNITVSPKLLLTSSAEPRFYMNRASSL